jgi:hypothetical protein
MVFCWDREKLTHAWIKDFLRMPNMPNAFELRSFRGIFPDDIRVVSHTKPVDFMEVGSHIFVSAKVKTILNDYHAAVEFFPVTLAFRRQDSRDWYYLHLLQEVDCLDTEKTMRAGPQDAQPELIRYMVLKESACAGIPLFRIADSSKIGVSDGLAQALTEAKCTGAYFVKPEDWRNAALHYG